MSIATRRSIEAGRPDLAIDIGAPTFQSDTPTPPEVDQKTEAEIKPKKKRAGKVASPPTPGLEKILAEKYPWLIDGKPKDSKLLLAVWWLYTRTRLHLWAPWAPLPREVLSYAKAAEAKKEAANQLTAKVNATGQASVKALKGGVGKTEISCMLTAGARIAAGVESLLIDVNLDGATAMSRFPIDPELVGTGMNTPTLIGIYEAAFEKIAPKLSEEEFKALSEDERDAYIQLRTSPETHNQVIVPTLRQLLERPDRPYKDPVSKALIIADDYTDADFSLEEFENAMRYARRLAYFVVGDTPPGGHQTATKGIDRQVTAQVIIGRYDQEISLKRVRSMKKEGQVEEVPLLSTLVTSKEAPKIRLRGRSNTPLAIINATPKRHCNRRTQYRLAEFFGTAPDHVLPIPFIPGLDKRPLDIESFDARTRYHIYDLVLRVFEKLAEYNEAADQKNATKKNDTQPTH